MKSKYWHTSTREGGGGGEKGKNTNFGGGRVWFLVRYIDPCF
jgi:hypothetical protein